MLTGQINQPPICWSTGRDGHHTCSPAQKQVKTTNRPTVYIVSNDLKENTMNMVKTDQNYERYFEEHSAGSPAQNSVCLAMTAVTETVVKSCSCVLLGHI